MNVVFEQFLVVSSRDYDRFSERGKNDYTESGVHLYDVNQLVPVIIKGQGCLANARISAITITQSGTTVTFTLTEIAKATSEAAYNMYKNQVSAGNSSTGDKYEDAKDSVIPGIYTGSSRKFR